MADSTIGVTEGNDKLLDTSELTLNGNQVHRERVVLASNTEDGGLVRVMGEDDAFSSLDYALIVQEMPARNPTRSHETASITVNATHDFDTPTIGDTDTILKLLWLSIGGAAPWQADVIEVLDDTEGQTFITIFGNAGDTKPMHMPDKSFINITDPGLGATFTGIRVKVTNCDTGSTSSLFSVSMYWDQVNP